MRVVIHLSKCFDWQPAPADTVVNPTDIASGKARVSAQGKFLLRVPVERETYTTLNLSEEQIRAKIIDEKCRPAGGRTLTRQQAVAFFVAEHVIPLETTRKWIKGFEVHDDGGELNEGHMRAQLAPHIPAGNIDAEDVDAHVSAYMQTPDAAAMESFLNSHFRIGKGAK